MKFERRLIGCIAAAGLAGGCAPASAAIWDLTFAWSGAAGGPATEVATIDSTAGFGLATVEDFTPVQIGVGYSLLSDSQGNNEVNFYGGAGAVETTGGNHFSDRASPALWTSGSSANIAPGNTYNLVGGSTLTVTAAPEASTWAMMLVGFAGLGVVGYRRKQRPIAQTA
jgi:hypothetical protein